jgi:hypothetical protein
LTAIFGGLMKRELMDQSGEVNTLEYSARKGGNYNGTGGWNFKRVLGVQSLPTRATPGGCVAPLSAARAMSCTVTYPIGTQKTKYWDAA